MLKFKLCENNKYHAFIGDRQYTIFISHCKSSAEEWDKFLLYERHCCSTDTIIGIFDSFYEAVFKVENLIKENISNIKNNLQHQMDILKELDEKINE